MVEWILRYVFGIGISEDIYVYRIGIVRLEGWESEIVMVVKMVKVVEEDVMVVVGSFVGLFLFL